MPRKLLIASLAIVGLHLAEVPLLGTSWAGSLAGNLLQVAACAFAVAMCLGAARRAAGMSRLFWVLVGAGIASWGIGNLGWMYYEAVLRAEPPADSAVHFIFGTQSVILAMSLFLDPERDAERLSMESALDFLQLSIIFFLIFLSLYFLPATHGGGSRALLGQIRLETIEGIVVIAIALLQMWRAPVRQARRLYKGLAVYLAIYTAGALVAGYRQYLSASPTGSLFDLAWTVPLLCAALWAGSWRPESEPGIAGAQRRHTPLRTVASNAAYNLTPLVVLIQVSLLPPGNGSLRFSLLGASILLCAIRLAVSQVRETRAAEDAKRRTLAIESAIEGVAILNEGGVYTYLNSAHARILGYDSPAELLGKNWHMLYEEDEARRIEDVLSKQLKQLGSWTGEATARRRDGSHFPQEVSLTLLSDGGLVCVMRDISERRSAERARSEAEAKFRALIEQIAAISYIAEIGVHGRWLYVSPQIETMFGYAPDEWLMLSSEWVRHVHQDDHETIRRAEEACERGEPFQAEYRLTRKDGQAVWVSDTAVVVDDGRGRRVMEGIIIDINERKQLEGQLQQARRMEAVGRLAGGIAHDFNNLLTIIRGYAELAGSRPGGSPQLHADIRRIEDSSERAAALVRQLLAFSRKQVLQPRVIDLNAVIMGLQPLLQRVTGESVELQVHASRNGATVKADPTQIEQVLMNLAVNARDAMPSGGRLTIETDTVSLDAAYSREHSPVVPGCYVMLAVTDTGTGMSAETKAHLFEPFFSTKSGTHGTGLGLSTVYGIVKQSGGYIWVYSELNRGSTFKIYLPAAAEPAEALPVPAVVGRVPRGQETVLLVEDNEGVRDLARVALETYGYRVLASLDAMDAERICRTHDGAIDLLLTDVVMPGVSGRELATHISTLRPGIRVLYMSGYTDNVIAHGGLLERGIAFLQKPFAPAVLAVKVREVLDTPPAPLAR